MSDNVKVIITMIAAIIHAVIVSIVVVSFLPKWTILLIAPITSGIFASIVIWLEERR